MKTATLKTPVSQHASGSQHLTIRYSQLAKPVESETAVKHRNMLSRRIFARFVAGTCIVVALVLFGLLYKWSSYFLQSTILLLSGFVCWTFLEYVLHRFYVHAGKLFFGNALLVCGRYPNRTQRLKLFVVWIAILIMAVVFSRFLFLAVGFVGGWLWYCYMRVFVQWKGMAKLIPGLHRQHLYHLAGGYDKGFGWTTTWWDLWFQTAVPMGYIYSPGHCKRHNHSRALLDQFFSSQCFYFLLDTATHAAEK